LRALVFSLVAGAAMLAAPEAHAEDAPQTVTVPLFFVTVGDDTKVGIHVSLGGGPPQPFELDTGAAGFFAAEDDAWPEWTVVDDQPFEQTYGSGVTYEARTVRTSVAFQSLEGPEVRAMVEVGQILDGFGGPLGPRHKHAWSKALAKGDAPLYGAFYGDFGSDLHAGNGGLFAVLPQLPGNLSSGFIVSLGCRDRPPALTLGLTDDNRARFTSLVEMQPSKHPVPFPHSGYPTRDQHLVKGAVDLSYDGDLVSFETGVILDTGAPTTKIHEHGKDVRVPSSFLEPGGKTRTMYPGGEFALYVPGLEPVEDWLLRFETGEIKGFDRVEAKKDDKGYVNAGLNAFSHYDVMFDVEHGVVGFASCERERNLLPRFDVFDGAGALPRFRPAP
jgi:hypothetical protein